MRVRRLNTRGIERFEGFLDSVTAGPPQPYPEQVLLDDHSSERLQESMDVERRGFRSRFEAARYLYERLGHSGMKDVDRDKGLWAWLALFYFEQICPVDKSGHRTPGERARWVPAFTDGRRYYRHLLAGPYRIYQANRDDPARAMILLYGPLHTLGHFSYQIASRQELMTNKAVLELATDMYLDPSGPTHKRGAQTRGKPGTVFRFVDVLNQFDVTWDLYGMTKDELAAMLPREFDRFLKRTQQPVAAR